ncbi:hypothetical protein [Desulfosarcina ovata]|uniref:Uncharacterized protein n=1 Tax=Desulfosarcina ovata subsp. ovata TaxID=2752305 RepID=A0A5K8AHD0_9BACT|nr:hypothetical protein [Desulfosarcina ovata]BBO91958.1 hypothetical protein DSCOOX_51380 [Desulfosarcina ovata subsp. ovata]
MNKINNDGTIAHYTRKEFLENILKKKQIKLGHVSNLGDPRESSLSWVDTESIGSEIDLKQWKHVEKIKKGKRSRGILGAQSGALFSLR